MGLHGYTTFSGISFESGSGLTPALDLRGSALSTSGGPLGLGGGVLSLGTVSFSIATASLQSQIPNGHLGLIQAASGLSLVFRSGNTIYTVGASAVSAAV